MVGFWNLGLKMIPNDRPRSSRGSPDDFGQTISKVEWKIQISAKTKSQKNMENRVFPENSDTNGWAPHGIILSTAVL